MRFCFLHDGLAGQQVPLAQGLTAPVSAPIEPGY